MTRFYKVISMTLSNRNRQEYEASIQEILDIHRNETEPFTIIADYQNFADDPTIPLWLRLSNIFRVWNVARYSQWNKVFIVTGATYANNIFLHWCQQILSRGWNTYVAKDIEDAYRIAEEIDARVVRHP